MSDELLSLDPDRPIREELPDSHTVRYRASTFGGCLRALAASAWAYSPASYPAWFQDVLDEGHAAEPQIIAMYEERYGDQVTDRQRALVLPIGEINGKRIEIAGSIDGLTQDVALFEAKKFRKSTFPEFKRRGVEIHAHYPWQVSTYMHALGLTECVMVGGLWDENTQKIVDIHVVRLNMPPLPLKALRMRAATLEGMIENSKLGPLDVPCNGMYPCPFHYLHDEKAVEQPKRTLTDPEFTAAVSKFVALKARRKELDDAIKDVDEQAKLAQLSVMGWLEANGEAGAKDLQVQIGKDRATINRVTYERAEYVVPASTIDYLTVVTDGQKKARAAKAAATRKRNKENKTNV